MIANRVVPGTVTVRAVEETGLQGLREPWNRLAGGVPFQTWDWLEASWRHFRTPDRLLRTLAVYNARGELVGLAPWYAEHTRFSGRVIRFLGSEEAGSDYLSIPTTGGYEATVADALADWLTDEAAGTWDLLHLQGVDARDEPVRRLVEALRQRHCTAHVTEGMNCWRLQLPGNWDEFLAARSKGHRYRCRKLFRDFFETGRAVVRPASDAESFEQGFEILVDLHQRRRQSLGEPGCFSNEQFRKFLKEAGRRNFENNRLQMQWIEYEGTPVAADFCLKGNGCVYGYQCGINPDYPRLRAGWLSIMSNLMRATEEGYAEFDFLRGDEEYKRHWGSSPRPTREVRIVPRQARARLKHTVWATGRNLKQIVKHGCRRVGLRAE